MRDADTRPFSRPIPQKNDVLQSLHQVLAQKGDSFGMIDVNQLRKGTTFVREKELYKVVDYQHIKSGRGGATIRLTVRNLRSGSNSQMTFPSGNMIQDVRVEGRMVQYLYQEGDFLTFMDLENYEQPQLRRDVFGDDFLYLKENMELKLNSLDGEIIDYELPTTGEYTVTQAEMAIAGDRAQNPSKKVTIETGREITVPMFVGVGDVIKVNLEEGTYITRINSR